MAFRNFEDQLNMIVNVINGVGPIPLEHSATVLDFLQNDKTTLAAIQHRFQDEWAAMAKLALVGPRINTGAGTT